MKCPVGHFYHPHQIGLISHVFQIDLSMLTSLFSLSKRTVSKRQNIVLHVYLRNNLKIKYRGLEIEVQVDLSAPREGVCALI